jgi:hypothetical protein
MAGALPAQAPEAPLPVVGGGLMAGGGGASMVGGNARGWGMAPGDGGGGVEHIHAGSHHTDHPQRHQPHHPQRDMSKQPQLQPQLPRQPPQLAGAETATATATATAGAKKAGAAMLPTRQPVSPGGTQAFQLKVSHPSSGRKVCQLLDDGAAVMLRAC